MVDHYPIRSASVKDRWLVMMTICCNRTMITSDWRLRNISPWLLTRNRAQLIEIAKHLFWMHCQTLVAAAGEGAI